MSRSTEYATHTVSPDLVLFLVKIQALNCIKHVQSTKQKELANLRTVEEQQLATAVLDQHAREQRERGEIADLHSKHDILREYEVINTFAAVSMA